MLAESLIIRESDFLSLYTIKLKKISMKRLIQAAATFLVVTALALPVSLHAQDKDAKLMNDSKDAKANFIKVDSLMQHLFNNSVGYVIFPNVGKGAIGVGGAAGNGILYEGEKAVGRASMKQVNVGFQFGGKAYREVIFFENQASLDRFKQDKFEFDAQASAVAATVGAAGNVKYRDGVMIFTQE